MQGGRHIGPANQFNGGHVVQQRSDACKFNIELAGDWRDQLFAGGLCAIQPRPPGYHTRHDA